MFPEVNVMLNTHHHVLDASYKVAVMIILGFTYTDMRPSGSRFAFVAALVIGFQAFLASIYLRHDAARLTSAVISIISAMSALLLFYLPEKIQWMAYLPVNLMLTFCLGGLCKWLMTTIRRKLGELLVFSLDVQVLARKELSTLDLEAGTIDLVTPTLHSLPLLATNMQRQRK